MLPRGMPKRKGKDVLDMTSFGEIAAEVIMVRQEEDEEAAAEPEDEDDADDGERARVRTRTKRGRILIGSYIFIGTQ